MPSRSFSRYSLITLVLALLAIPAAAEEDAAADPEWQGKVSLGGSISRSTIDGFKGHVEAAAERDFDPHLVRLGLLAAYGETNPDGAKPTVDNNKQELTEYYRYTYTDRLYVYVDGLQGRDSVQAIKLRLLTTAGPGWRAWHKSNKQFLDLELGSGYRYESRRDDANRSDFTGRLGGTFATLLGPAEFKQSGEYLVPFNETGAWLAKAKTSLSFPLTDAWSFENSLQLQYNNRPASGTKQFSLDYIISLVYGF